MALLSTLAGSVVGATVVAYASRKDYMNLLKRMQKAMVGIQASMIHNGNLKMSEVYPSTEEYRQQVRDIYQARYQEPCPDDTVQPED